MYHYDIIIRNTSYVNPKWEIEKGLDIVISQGKILRIEQGIEGTAECEIDGRYKLFLPGLIDGHIHLNQQFLRGRVLDALPPIWSRVMIPFESTLNEKIAKVSAQLACLEMIKSGTTGFIEAGGYFMDTIAPVIIESGLRGALTCSTMTSGPDTIRTTVDRALEINNALFDEFHGEGDGRIVVYYSLRSYMDNTDNLIQRIFGEADKRKTGVHIHLDEYPGNITECISRYQKRPLEYLDSYGVLGSNMVAAHCILLSDNEIELIHKNKIKVIHCPFSNCGKGVPPTPRLLYQNCFVGLGTDGAAHGGLSLWNEMKIFRSVMNVHYGTVLMEPSIMPAKAILKMATEGSAAALGLQGKAGKIEVGTKADLISVNLRQPHIMPSGNLLNTLLESVNAGDVSDSIIDGKFVMKDREVLTMDEELVMAQAEKIYSEIGSSL